MSSRNVSLDNRMKVFKYSHKRYFANHVINFLNLSFVQLDQFKQSETYKLCEEALCDNSPEKLERLQKQCYHYAGLNFPLVFWIIDICKFIELKISIIERPDKLITDDGRYKEKLVEFADFYNKSEKSFDEHTLLLLSWWFPQLVEILTLTQCASKFRSEKDKDKEILRRIGQFKTCYQFFKKNTAMAMFLLLGAYLSSNKWTDWINKNTDPQNEIVNLLNQLDSKIKENVNIIRELITLTSKRKDLISSFSDETRPLNGYYENLQEKILLEPSYQILISFCRLILVKHQNDSLGRNIIHYCIAKNILINVIKNTISLEVSVTKSKDVLFREESVATKLISALFFSPWGGYSYLYQLVQPLINDISKSQLANVEIDISIPEHVQMIIQFCEIFLKRLYTINDQFPNHIRILLAYAQQLVIERFPDMKQKVIGGFLFLRFVIPTLVSPERYHLKAGNLFTQKVIIYISRVLQCIANGVPFDASRGDVSKLNVIIDTHLDNLHQYFDSFGQVQSFGDVGFKYVAEPVSVANDFEVITTFLYSLAREMKEIILDYYPSSLPLFQEFLTLRNPSICQQLVENEDFYATAVKSFIDVLPNIAVEELLGLMKKNKKNLENNSPYVWFKRVLYTNSKANMAVEYIQQHQPLLAELLTNIIHFHEYLSNMIVDLPSGQQASEDIKRSMFRKAFMIHRFHYNIIKSPVAIFVPEIWDAWSSFLQLIDSLIEVLLCVASSSKGNNNRQIKDVIGSVIVLTRWTVSRLISLQEIQTLKSN